jgi:hypothetical protein
VGGISGGCSRCRCSLGGGGATSRSTTRAAGGGAWVRQAVGAAVAQDRLVVDTSVQPGGRSGLDVRGRLLLDQLATPRLTGLSADDGRRVHGDDDAEADATRRGRGGGESSLFFCVVPCVERCSFCAASFMQSKGSPALPPPPQPQPTWFCSALLCSFLLCYSPPLPCLRPRSLVPSSLPLTGSVIQKLLGRYRTRRSEGGPLHPSVWGTSSYLT